jgi:lysophospholipase L1-like esterase
MIRKLLLAVTVPVALLLLFEAALRLTGRPHGTFTGTEQRLGLWEPNTSRELRFGPIPYRVEANSKGFRGPELRAASEPAAFRIAAIGDSMTDGFFVDNEATYPSFLQQSLHRRGFDAEVVNAARGGGSIDLFLQRLEELVLPLEPQIVIASFVTNDLHELGGVSAARGPLAELGSAFVTRSALGEALMDLQLELRGARPASDDARYAGLELSGAARYRIPGGERYAENAQEFVQRYRRFDSQLLADPLPSELQRLLEDEYFPLLAQFHELCAERDIGFLFVYFPAYPQIYLSGAPSAIQDQLAERSRELGIPFLDLTPAMRADSEPLHLAPLDYHLNPRGNRVVAEAVAAALIEHGLLPRSAPKGERVLPATPPPAS